MKKIVINILLCSCAIFFAGSCKKGGLDIEPISILTAEQVFQSEPAVIAYMASLYDALPWEEFGNSGRPGWNTQLANNTDEAITSIEGQVNSIGDGTWTPFWGYNHVRNVNDFLQRLPASPLNEELKATLLAEAKFIRAFYYFGMVKRYGGVPIIKEVQEFTGDNISELQVPRDKEADVYDFIAADLDEAVASLPVMNEKGRATKSWAYALKSRAMLYAASSAKYGNVLLNGIVGIPSSEADKYWQASFDAANAVIVSGMHSLYQKNADKEQNFQQLFLDEDNPEAIVAKYYSFPEKAHGYDVSALPFGVRSPEGYGSAINPTLELVEQFEYIDGTPGTLNLGTPSNPVYYSDPLDLFANKDPRLLASVIVPFSDWRGTTIDVQAGIYDQGVKWEAGSYDALYNVNTHQPDNVNGTLHIVGLNGLGGSEKTQTGFYVRKYLNSNVEQAFARFGRLTQPWLAIRYAEVLLNYAEAAVELGNIPDAKDKINMIRTRAGIVALDDADITLDRVRHERLVELAFENHRWWDYRRWRLSDNLFNNTWVTGIRPYYDVQQNAYRFEKAPAGVFPKTFDVKVYLERIPPDELAKNPNLVQNPNY